MISVYDIGNEDFGNLGDAVLTPVSGRVRQASGGGYDLTLEHPIDPAGKWTHLVPGAIVKVPVPVETIENSFSGEEAWIYRTTEACALRDRPVEPQTVTYPDWAPASSAISYHVGSKVGLTVAVGDRRNYECTYWDGTSSYMQVAPNRCSWWKEIGRVTSGGAALATLPAGTELYWIADEDSTWYKMATYWGLQGYVKRSQVAFYKHTTPEENQPRVIRDQLFRLQEPSVNSERNTVSVTGQHVSYDLAGDIVRDVVLNQAPPAMAVSRVDAGLMIPYRGTIATNLTGDDLGTYTGDLRGKNGIFCLLDPDKGIVKAFDAKFTRDNWDLFVMKRTRVDRGFRLRYGKNVDGITWKRSSSGLVNRIVPVAKDEGGADLYLPEMWVDSDTIGSYPVIVMEQLRVQGQVGKDDGTDTGTVWTEAALLDEMRAKAAERFTVDRVDQVTVDVTVQFEQLGAMAEYPELKALESVLLYDTVQAIDERIGLSVELTVTELEFDIIRERVTGIKLSNADAGKQRSVAGFNIANNSITPAKMTEDFAQSIVSQVRDIIPEYADPTAARPSSNIEIATGEWTPHVYDNDTKVAELGEQTWYKIGSFYFLPVTVNSFPSVNISTMLQIRNAPCRILGGNAYCANFSGQLGDRTVQAANERIYFRPNVTGAISGGAFTAMLIGM